MADDFELFLASALRPDERLPDRQFVRRVQARIAFEEQLSAHRRYLVAGFVQQLFGLAVVTGGLWWVSRAAPVGSWFLESPAAGLGILLTIFLFLIAVLSARSGPVSAPRPPL